MCLNLLKFTWYYYIPYIITTIPLTELKYCLWVGRIYAYQFREKQVNNYIVVFETADNTSGEFECLHRHVTIRVTNTIINVLRSGKTNQGNPAFL